jgi:hypothetical protein
VGVDRPELPDQAVVAALTAALAPALTARMTAAGWSVDLAKRARPMGNDLPSFRHPIEDGFAATVEFELVGLWQSGDPPVKVAAEVGVDYEPAYCLAPLMLGRESYSEYDTELGELLDPPSDFVVTMSKTSDADDVARQLVEPILTHALDHARGHASVEDMVDAARTDPDFFDLEIEQVPLLLAAAGRHDEAREALARYQATGDWQVAEPEYRRFARQLRLWMDAGAVLPDPPTGPVRSTPAWSERSRPSFGDARAKSRARREAFDSVRHQAAGKTHDELRAMLREEYERRDLPVSQLAIEAAIDAIEVRQTPLGTFTATAQGIALVAHQGWRLTKAIVDLVKLMRSEDEPDLSERPRRPSWLEPPEEAAYPVGTDRHRDDWMTVELDRDAPGFLQRAHAALEPVLGRPAALSPINTVLLDAWLSWDTTPPIANSRLIVHVGEHTVGTLVPADAARLTPVMDAAAIRQELPQMKATLTTFNRPPHYLLEIDASGLPAPT